MEKNDSEIKKDFATNEISKLNQRPRQVDSLKECCGTIDEKTDYKIMYSFEEKEDGEIDDDREGETSKETTTYQSAFIKDDKLSNQDIVYENRNELEGNNYDEEDDNSDDYSVNNKKLKIDESDLSVINVIEKRRHDDENIKNNTEQTKLLARILVTTNTNDKTLNSNEYQRSDHSIGNDKINIPTNSPCDSLASSLIQTSVSKTEENNSLDISHTIDPFFDSNSSKSIDIGDEESDYSRDSYKKTQELKVPPLKIIYTNQGGHPYIKTEDDLKKDKKEQLCVGKKELELELYMNCKNDINSNSSNDNSNTPNPIINKCNRNLKLTATSPNSTTNSKSNFNKRITLETENSFLSTNNSKLSPTQSSMTPMDTKETNNTINNSSQNIQNSFQIIENSATTQQDIVIKRKLRSHTRQQNSDLSFAKSPSSSPTTVPQDNQLNETNTLDQNFCRTTVTNISDINNINITDLSNDGFAIELETENSDSILGLDAKANVRRKRCQSQVQAVNMSEFLINNSINENYDHNNAVSNNIINDLCFKNNELEYKENRVEIDTIQLSLDKFTQQQDTLKNINQSNLENSETVISKNTENCDPNSGNYLPLNGIKQYIEIKNQISKRRDFLMQSKEDFKFPKIFQDFVINKKNYLIKKNTEIQQLVPFYKPTNELPENLNEYFLKQEKERYSLRLRHKVEQDKLVILFEQEIVRCYNQLLREDINQNEPFSFCSIIKDEEIYSVFQNEISCNQIPISCQSFRSINPANEFEELKLKKLNNQEYQSKLLLVITDLKKKFQKMKDDLIKRQLNESDSLHAVQKMNFQSKIREISNKIKFSSTNVHFSNAANSNIFTLIQNVPIVHVNNKFFDSFDCLMNLNNLFSIFLFT